MTLKGLGLKVLTMKNSNNSKTPLSRTLTKSQRFCLEVKQLAAKYKLPFFVVTDGASATYNNDCEAVKHARTAHIRWEKRHDIAPDHDWEK